MRRDDINNYPPAWLEVSLLQNLAQGHPDFVDANFLDDCIPIATCATFPSGWVRDEEVKLQLEWHSDEVRFTWPDWQERIWELILPKKTLSSVYKAVGHGSYSFRERLALVVDATGCTAKCSIGGSQCHHVCPIEFQYSLGALVIYCITSLPTEDSWSFSDNELVWAIRLDEEKLAAFSALMDHQEKLDRWRASVRQRVVGITRGTRPGRSQSEIDAVAEAVIEDIEWVLSEGESFDRICWSSFSSADDG